MSPHHEVNVMLANRMLCQVPTALPLLKSWFFFFWHKLFAWYYMCILFSYYLFISLLHILIYSFHYQGLSISELLLSWTVLGSLSLTCVFYQQTVNSSHETEYGKCNHMIAFFHHQEQCSYLTLVTYNWCNSMCFLHHFESKNWIIIENSTNKFHKRTHIILNLILLSCSFTCGCILWCK